MKATKKTFIREYKIPTEDTVVYTPKDNTSSVAKAFESVIIVEPDGSEYAMNRSKFDSRYNIIDTKFAETKPVTIDFIFNTTDLPITFTASWGESITAFPGAAIVIEDNKFGYAIQSKEFNDTYEVNKG